MSPPSLGPKALDAAVLRVRAGDEPVGVGFLVSSELALTCAHVVSAALGQPDDQVPGSSARVRVDLPLLRGGGPPVEARVEHWRPERDVAVLRLTAPLPGGRPVRLVEPGDVWEHPARAFGFPAGRDGGVWHSGLLRARQADGWVQLDLAGSGYPVSGGFSGGPVWDEQLVGVVGMMTVAESRTPPASFLVPAGDLIDAWPPLRKLVLPPSPYPGLTAFQEADAAFFHGRGEENGELTAKVAAEPRVCLVGPSGSGKSSLALAGVVPRLRKRGWTVAVMRPGRGLEPLMALAAALHPLLEPGTDPLDRLRKERELREELATGGLGGVARLVLEQTGAERLLIIVDQYEELVTLGPEAAAPLTDVLFGRSAPTGTHVLATLRADFVETVLADPRFGAALRGGIYALRPMSREGLLEVVTAPVAATPGVAYQEALADRVLTDTGDAPGALPLLSFTLDLLWEQQSGGYLTHKAYADLGGVGGALTAHAEQVWEAYADDDEAALRLLSRLIRLPIGSAAATRRTAFRAELDDREWAVAERLAATRLLVTGGRTGGEQTVELAHDALITGWKRLSTWVAENLAFLTWREAVDIDLTRWEESGRSPDLLPTPTGLAAADRWLRERPADLTGAAREYLELGRRHHRSRLLRRRGLWSVLSVLVVLALVFGSLFAYQRHVSAENDALATSRALVESSAQERQDPARAVMLALAAYRAAPTREARDAMFRLAVTYATSERTLSGLTGKLGQVVAGRDGDVLVANATSGGVTLFTHAVDGRMHQRTLASEGQVFRPVASADGKRVGFINQDGSAVWFDVLDRDHATVSPPHHVAGSRAVPENSFADEQTGMSADGKVIAWWSAGHVVWHNLDTGARGSAASPAGGDDTLWFGPDDHTILTTVLGSAPDRGQTVVAVDLRTGKRRTVIAKVGSWLPSGDGTVIDYCRTTGGASVTSALRVADGAKVGRPYRTKEPCALKAVDLSGHRIVTGITPASMVDLDTGRQIAAGHPLKDVYRLAGHLVSHNGVSSVIGYTDAGVVLTRLTPAGISHPVAQFALTPDGRRVISESKDGTRLWLRTDDGSHRVLAVAARDAPVRPSGQYDYLRVDRAGTLFADREGRNTVSIRELPSLRERARITTPMPPPESLDPEGSLEYFFAGTSLITESGTRVDEWDTATGRRIGGFDASVLHPITLNGIAEFSVTEYPGRPHRVAVIVQGDARVRVVDLRTGRITTGFRTEADAIGLRFDRDGDHFVLMRHGSVPELWQRHPLRREAGPLPSVEAPPWTGKFLADGRYLLAANGVIQIYRLGDQAERDTYDPGLDGDGNEYEFIDASADGRTVLIVGGDIGQAMRLDPAAWRRDLCELIGHRDFTPAERSAEAPVKIPPGPVCG